MASGLFKSIFISIHALTRSATNGPGMNLDVAADFNPRTHEECDAERILPGAEGYHFNPRTHEECDRKQFSRIYQGIISIHALTRSATVATAFLFSFKAISIHALTRSATTNTWGCCNNCMISIHALTRSATF